MYRHGDVLVAPVDRVPADARRLSHRTLAEGESTGHSHRIAEPGLSELYDAAGRLYLRVTGAQATLIHQEHAPIKLPAGDYRVWRQREYSPEAIRVVRD